VTDDYPELFLFFACLYALVPRVPKPYIVTTSAIFEPGTAATTTTHFSRFRDVDAFWAYQTDCRRRSLFARLHALKPAVIYVPISSTSTVLVPSAARSAAADSAGFSKRAALWTYRRTKGRRWCEG